MLGCWLAVPQPFSALSKRWIFWFEKTWAMLLALSTLTRFPSMFPSMLPLMLPWLTLMLLVSTTLWLFAC